VVRQHAIKICTSININDSTNMLINLNLNLNICFSVNTSAYVAVGIGLVGLIGVVFGSIASGIDAA
jgi:hypothetical protein